MYPDYKIRSPNGVRGGPKWSTKIGKIKRVKYEHLRTLANVNPAGLRCSKLYVHREREVSQ